MAANPKVGQTLVLTITIGALRFDVSSSLVPLLRGFRYWPSEVFRWFATAALSYLLYRGFQIVRWLCVALFAGTGAFMVYSLLRMGVSNADGVMLLVVGLLFMVSAGTLVWSPSVKSFLAGQRSRRGGHVRHSA